MLECCVEYVWPHDAFKVLVLLLCQLFFNLFCRIELCGFKGICSFFEKLEHIRIVKDKLHVSNLANFFSTLFGLPPKGEVSEILLSIFNILWYVFQQLLFKASLEMTLESQSWIMIGMFFFVRVPHGFRNPARDSIVTNCNQLHVK